MEWTDQHDTLFLREVLVSDLYQTRKGSPERGKLWDGIAARLNNLSEQKFYVNKRSLRDRLNLLMAKFKAKTRDEERASGISPEVRETDVLLEELCEKEQEAGNKSTAAGTRKKVEQDKATAEKMRFKAMETMGQTQKRNQKSSGETPAKKSRKSVGDALAYLQDKAKEEMALRKEEIDIKKQEEARSSLLSEQQNKMQQQMLTIIQHQHQEQGKQQQEQQKQQERHQQQQLLAMQSMLSQQQQQSKLLLTLFEKFAPKQN